MTTLCFQFIYLLGYFHILWNLASSWGTGGLNIVITEEQQQQSRESERHMDCAAACLSIKWGSQVAENISYTFFY